MPLRCTNTIEDKSIMAFDLTDTEWGQLRRDNRKDQCLKLPCCDADVVLKTSHLGNQFFAHKQRGDCAAPTETIHHRLLKEFAVIVARSYGWNAETEVPGKTPTGEDWIADVLATKGDSKIAIEIQWSKQSYEVTRHRQKRYAASGIRCLWLLQRVGKDFVDTDELPMARIERGDDGQYYAHLDNSYWDGHTFRVDEFLRAAFSGHFKFGIPHESPCTVAVRVGQIKCSNCKRSINIVTSVCMEIDGHWNIHL